MKTPEITIYAMGSVDNATAVPYDKLHLTYYMDLWLWNNTVGLDHIFYEDGEVEFRVGGKLLSELP